MQKENQPTQTQQDGANLFFFFEEIKMIYWNKEPSSTYKVYHRKCSQHTIRVQQQWKRISQFLHITKDFGTDCKNYNEKIKHLL